jgi:hypothetical protein
MQQTGSRVYAEENLSTTQLWMATEILAMITFFQRRSICLMPRFEFSGEKSAVLKTER